MHVTRHPCGWGSMSSRIIVCAAMAATLLVAPPQVGAQAAGDHWVGTWYQSGDHLHPNDAGYQLMGNAINLDLFSTSSASAATCST
jgi:lysophospholipase L1-like esterase